MNLNSYLFKEKTPSQNKKISGVNFSNNTPDYQCDNRLLIQRIEELENQNKQLIQAEKEFHAEREYYKDIFNNQPAGLYRIKVFPVKKWKNKNWLSSENPPYTMEFASDRFCEIIGVTRNDFFNNPFIISNLVVDDDKKSFARCNENANKKIIPFRWEGRINLKKDVRWIRLESLPKKLETGDILWTGILYDITERKQTEAALNQSRLLLEDVLTGANVGTLEWNIQTGKIKFNQIWAKNLGYTLAEIKIGLMFLGSKGWKRITHPDDVPYAEKMLERHFSGELPYHQVEVRMKHKHGHWVWIRQEGKVKTWTPDGKPLLMYGTHTDITQRKTAEEELSKLNDELEMRVAKRTAELEKLNAELKVTEQKFRTVSDFTYDWEYWRGTDGKIIFMSPSVERITGYTIGEFEENPNLLDSIIYKSDLKIWQEHKQERCIHDSTEKRMEITFRIVAKNGEIRWMGHVCRCICVDGKNLGVRVSNRDITEKVAADNALLDITMKVEERERNRFSRELHDGMGPLLSTVKLYFDWLADTDDAEKRKMIIEKGGHCIETAIQTARELSSGMSSQLLINLGYNKAIEQFIQRINETNKIEISYHTNTYQRYSDFVETTLYRITTELIKNTLTYGKASKAEISLLFQEQNNSLNFKYSDNGIGFDTAFIGENQKGLGIMNINQRVKVLRGKIQIESKHGEGMKAFIQIPVDVSI